MPHRGLDQLLEDFAIDEAADYYLLPPGKQSVFVSRLYSELEDHARSGLATLKDTAGLKLHFMVEPGEDGGFRNLPDDVFFRKICFYASRAVLTFPFRESGKAPREIVLRGKAAEVKRNKEIISFGRYRAGRDGYGGKIEEVGKNHHLYRSELDIFLHLLCSARPFLKAGFLTIVPSYYPEARKIRVHTKSHLGLVPANFQREDLRRQFAEEGFEEYDFVPGSVPYLYLPYFTHLSSSEVLWVREKEANAYRLFQDHLSELLNGLSRVKSEGVLMDHMKEVHRQVLALMGSYEAIEKATRQQAVDSVMGFFKANLVPSAPGSLVPSLTKILGTAGVAFVEYLAKKGALNQQKAQLKVAQPEINLMWRLVDLDKGHFHPKGREREPLEVGSL